MEIPDKEYLHNWIINCLNQNEQKLDNKTKFLVIENICKEAFDSSHYVFNINPYFYGYYEHKMSIDIGINDCMYNYIYKHYPNIKDKYNFKIDKYGRTKVTIRKGW